LLNLQENFLSDSAKIKKRRENKNSQGENVCNKFESFFLLFGRNYIKKYCHHIHSLFISTKAAAARNIKH
jgi:hypothetical protein